MAQRILSAKNVAHASWGALFAGLLKLPALFLMVLPGTAAMLLYPELPPGDLVSPTRVMGLLPVGFRGLVCAGFVAGASTLVTMDFVGPLRPQTSDRALLTTGRVVGVVLMALAAAWAPTLGRHPSCSPSRRSSSWRGASCGLRRRSPTPTRRPPSTWSLLDGEALGP